MIASEQVSLTPDLSSQNSPKEQFALLFYGELPDPPEFIVDRLGQSFIAAIDEQRVGPARVFCGRVGEIMKPIRVLAQIGVYPQNDRHFIGYDQKVDGAAM